MDDHKLAILHSGEDLSHQLRQDQQAQVIPELVQSIEIERIGPNFLEMCVQRGSLDVNDIRYDGGLAPGGEDGSAEGEVPIEIRVRLFFPGIRHLPNDEVHRVLRG